MISNGLNVVYVSHQLGHANPNVTLAHLYAQADHAHTPRQALEASHPAIGVASSCTTPATREGAFRPPPSLTLRRGLRAADRAYGLTQMA